MLSDVILVLSENNNPTNPLNVKGYGQISHETAVATTISRLEAVINGLKNADENAWANAKHALYSSGVLEEIINAAINSNNVDV